MFSEYSMINIQQKINHFSKYSIYKPSLTFFKYKLIKKLQIFVNNENKLLMYSELASIVFLILFLVFIIPSWLVILFSLENFIIVSRIWTFLLYIFYIFSGISFLIYFLSKLNLIYLKMKGITQTTEGKIFTGLLIYSTNILATLCSKKIIHSLVHTDPENFQEFIAICNLFIDFLLILFILPLLFLGLFAILSSISTIVSGIFLFFMPIFSIIVIFPIMGKLLNSILEEFYINKILLLRLFSRFFGLVVICSFVWIKPLKIDENLVVVLSNNVNSLITQALIQVEYHENSICQNVESSQKVAYLKGNLVSIATYNVENNQYQFTVKRCLIKA